MLRMRLRDLISPVTCLLLMSLVVNTLVVLRLYTELPTPTKYKVQYSSYSENARQETCDDCQRHKFDYITKNDGICKSKFKSNLPLKLIILIFSSSENRKQRKVLRDTWLTLTAKNTSPFARHVFLLGKSDRVTDMAIKNESALYEDIVQEDFFDSFDNLTHKVVMGMKWVVKYCSNVRFVLKTDDDMFVNIAAIIRKIIPNYSNHLIKSVGGLCLQNEKPNRHKTSKYYLSNDDYPQSYFPPFCSGTGYMTSFPAISRLYEVSRNIPYLRLEDVYIGLCLQYLGYTTINIPFFTNIPTKFDSCEFLFENVITSHLDDTEELYSMWNGTCDEKTDVTHIESPIKVK